MLLVRAELALADGRKFEGFLTPQHEGEPLDLGVIQPQLFLPSGAACGFWDGMAKRRDDSRETFYAELGRDPKSIFPIDFRAVEGLAIGHVSGTIPGFCWRPTSKVKVYF
jgi:hypothetical protein